MVVVVVVVIIVVVVVATAAVEAVRMTLKGTILNSVAISSLFYEPSPTRTLTWKRINTRESRATRQFRFLVQRDTSGIN